MMEKDLIELFEAAKKAADAAAVAGDPAGEGPDVDRCVGALKRLKGFPVSYDVLVSTQVAKRLRHLTKHPIHQIQTVSTEVVDIWKKIIIDETRKKNGSIDSKRSVKIEVTKTDTVKVEGGHKAGSVKAENSGSVRVEKIDKVDSKKIGSYSRSESIKVEKKLGSVDTVKAEKINWSENVKAEQKPKYEKQNSGIKAEKSGSVKFEKVDTVESIKAEEIDSTENGKVEKIPKEDKQSSGMKRPFDASSAPLKLTKMVKCNDPIRDKMRELLVDAFSKVSGEADEDIKDEVESCDPIRVAVAVESTMFETMGRSNGAQKVKYRSIMFNLKDPKNPDLRRKVLLGEVSPEKLVNMTPEAMASDQRQRENDEIKQKALFECERAAAPKASTDQFKCGRCGKRECTYYQLQTRSADEPMTTFVTCVNCNNHWKFC